MSGKRFSTVDEMLEDVAPEGYHDPPKVVAILTADIHLSHKCPVARSAESSWYEAMKRSLWELDLLVNKYQVPVLCAGDVFHKWNSPPELINFAMNAFPSSLDLIPSLVSISGQHDQPHHNIEDLHKSAYNTVIDGTVCWNVDDVLEDKVSSLPNIIVYGFPYGKEITPLESPNSDCINIALCHQYVWSHPGTRYGGATIDSHLSRLRDKLKGYDIAVFGDNHIPFQSMTDGECAIVNCGCLIPRNSQERDYKPSVWLLHDDTSIKRHYMDISKDKWTDLEDALDSERKDSDYLDDFLDGLTELDELSLNFRDAVDCYLASVDHISEETKQVLLKAMEEE